MSDDFTLDTVALTDAYEGSYGPKETIAAFSTEVSRQIAAAGGPTGSLEEQLRAMLGAWKGKRYEATRDQYTTSPLCKAMHDAGFTEAQAIDELWKENERIRRHAIDAIQKYGAPMTIIIEGKR